MIKSELPPLLLVGCGKMGGAILAGWRERGLSRVVVVDPRVETVPVMPGLQAFPSLAEVPHDFHPAAVLLAIKPQEAPNALPALKPLLGKETLVVSIMAGRTLAYLQETLGVSALVRAMPNTPAAIRRGFSVACPTPAITPALHELATVMLGAVGEVAWVQDEALIDPVTAVSGGGPAYVFLLAELLEQAAIEQGLPADLARQMARATVAGSGALLDASTEDAAVLRKAVTSPKGTTERALAVLMQPEAWPQAVSTAITAATERSRELGR